MNCMLIHHRAGEPLCVPDVFDAVFRDSGEVIRIEASMNGVYISLAPAPNEQWKNGSHLDHVFACLLTAKPDKGSIRVIAKYWRKDHHQWKTN